MDLGSWIVPVSVPVVFLGHADSRLLTVLDDEFAKPPAGCAATADGVELRGHQDGTVNCSAHCPDYLVFSVGKAISFCGNPSKNKVPLSAV